MHSKICALWYSSEHYYINIVNLPNLFFITKPHNDILINDAYCRFCRCQPDVQRKLMFLAWEVKYKSYTYTDTPNGTNGRHYLVHLLSSFYFFLDTTHNTAPFSLLDKAIDGRKMQIIQNKIWSLLGISLAVRYSPTSSICLPHRKGAWAHSSRSQ